MPYKKSNHFPSVSASYPVGGRKLLLEGRNENVLCGLFVLVLSGFCFPFFAQGFFFFNTFINVQINGSECELHVITTN